MPQFAFVTALMALLMALPGTAAAATVTGSPSDGSITFTAAPEEDNSVTITFTGAEWTVTESGEDVPLDATGGCHLEARTATCPGGNNPDRTVTVFAGDGNDRVVLTAAAGTYTASELMGQEGNDGIVGGFGPDRIYTGAGTDQIAGRDGDDTLNGSLARPGEPQGTDFDDDSLDGGAGNDELTGGASDSPALNGGAGNDTIAGGDGEDNADGGAGDDVVQGEAGDDSLAGGDGDDVLDGGVGDDDVKGGKGADTANGGAGRDTLYGDASATGGPDGTNVLRAGADGDRIFGADGVDLASGGLGADRIVGGAGNDAIEGCEAITSGCRADGSDIISAGAGNDRVDGGAGPDLIGGEKGNDVITGGNAGQPDGADEIDGGSGSDQITGAKGADVIRGGAGADVLTDALRPDTDTDLFVCGDGVDRATPGAGDVLRIDCEQAAAPATCPTSAASGCRATLVLRAGRVTIGRGAVRVGRGTTAAVAAAINRRGRRLERKQPRLKVVARVKVVRRGTNAKISSRKTRFRLSRPPKVS
jgi:Ca2+-binding RTX toxin-like protein